MTFRYNKIIIPTLSTISGILWQHSECNICVPLALALFFITAKLFFSKNRKKTIIAFSVIATFFLFGVFRSSNQQKQQERNYQEFSNKEFATIATIKEIRSQDSRFYKNCITITTEKIKIKKEDTWKKANKKIQIYLRRLPEIQVCDKVKIKNLKFKKPSKSFSKYLMKENITANIFENNLDCEILNRPNISLSRYIFNKRNNLLSSIKRKMPKRPFAMFSSIFLGNRKINKKENDLVKNSFRLWGILHFLARSGLHLIIFLMLCELMLKLIPIYFNVKQMILIALSTIYLLLSWPSLSFIRAFSIFLLYKFCPLTNKKSDLVSLVAVVCLAMLLYNPIQLFFLDFQLSFGLTFALAMFTKEQSKRERKRRLKYEKK